MQTGRAPENERDVFCSDAAEIHRSAAEDSCRAGQSRGYRPHRADRQFRQGSSRKSTLPIVHGSWPSPTRVIRRDCPCHLQVRLREPLPIICRNPEIYDRSKVGEQCFDALQSLRTLRKVARLREAAEYGLFPTAAQLIQVSQQRVSAGITR